MPGVDVPERHRPAGLVLVGPALVRLGVPLEVRRLARAGDHDHRRVHHAGQPGVGLGEVLGVGGQLPEAADVGGVVEDEEAPALAEAGVGRAHGVVQRALDDRRVDGVLGVVADHLAAADDVLELHGAAACLTDDFETDVVGPRAGRSLGLVGRVLPAAVALGRARAGGLVRGAVRGARSGRLARRGRQRGGVVGLARSRVRWSPGRTWTRCSTAERTTDRSASSRRSRRSTCCARGGSCRPGRSGVSVFVEEEGSRFGLACLGSRLATGAVSWETARELRDRDGVFLADGLSAAGLRGLARPRVCSEGVGTFVELHVEQGRDLVDRSAAVGVASGIWPHGRYRYEFTGSADHAGTTRMEDRADPMLTYAMTALAANKQARLAGQRATFGRLEVTPNSTNSVPSGVTAWLDARASSARSLEDLVGAIERQASERASRDGTSLVVTPESVSGSVEFSTRARRAAGRPARLAGHPDRRRPRRRHPVGRRHPDRDALRPQPDGRVPLAAGDRGDGRLPRRGRRPWPTSSPSWPGTRRDGVPARTRLGRRGRARRGVRVEIEDGRFVAVELGVGSLNLSGGS